MLKIKLLFLNPFILIIVSVIYLATLKSYFSYCEGTMLFGRELYDLSKFYDVGGIPLTPNLTREYAIYNTFILDPSTEYSLNLLIDYIIIDVKKNAIDKNSFYFLVCFNVEAIYLKNEFYVIGQEDNISYCDHMGRLLATRYTQTKDEIYLKIIVSLSLRSLNLSKELAGNNITADDFDNMLNICRNAL